ncbi:hypothetical protein [Rhodobacter sp. SY28-1]|uniref:hypothetical protein n=1 Tax=Rhodobacter sp. SY28-1 TaxID=2562317 RepID=UPI0010BF9271|nr:hypothetical protein [Rhodobacter sp. SY28-1]
MPLNAGPLAVAVSVALSFGAFADPWITEYEGQQATVMYSVADSASPFNVGALVHCDFDPQYFISFVVLDGKNGDDVSRYLSEASSNENVRYGSKSKPVYSATVFKNERNETLVANGIEPQTEWNAAIWGVQIPFDLQFDFGIPELIVSIPITHGTYEDEFFRSSKLVEVMLVPRLAEYSPAFTEWSNRGNPELPSISFQFSWGAATEAWALADDRCKS